MNRRRVAALLRELADELEQEDDPQPAPPRPRREVLAPKPEVNVDDVTRARARRLLRRTGVATR